MSAIYFCLLNIPKCQYTSWSFATPPQQGEKFGGNIYSVINHSPDIVHRSCLLPPSLFVFSVAYDFDFRPSRCFCQLTFSPSTWFRHYRLVSHHIPMETNDTKIPLECFLTVVILSLLVFFYSFLLLLIIFMMLPIFHDPLGMFSWIWTTSPTHGSCFDCILGWRL